MRLATLGRVRRPLFDFNDDLGISDRLADFERRDVLEGRPILRRREKNWQVDKLVEFSVLVTMIRLLILFLE